MLISPLKGGEEAKEGNLNLSSPSFKDDEEEALGGGSGPTPVPPSSPAALLLWVCCCQSVGERTGKRHCCFAEQRLSYPLLGAGGASELRAFWGYFLAAKAAAASIHTFSHNGASIGRNKVKNPYFFFPCMLPSAQGKGKGKGGPTSQLA